MRCFKPLHVNKLAVPCGGCEACLVNRKRIWVTRMLMEFQMHKHSAFVTLTYSDANLPLVGQPSLQMGTLVKKDAQLFLKKLRRRLAPHRIRYFLVGEYGELTQRPHYHAAIFGLAGSLSAMLPQGVRPSMSFAESAVQSAWDKGHTQTGILAKESMEYLCGYVSKKLTKKSDKRLGERQPEFSLMSRNPPLGSGMIDEMASALLREGDDAFVDVPSVIRYNGREWPIGQSMKKRLRLRVGRPATTPKEVTDKMAGEIQPIRDWAFNRSMRIEDVLKEIHDGDAAALMGRVQLFKKRNKL